MNKVMNMEPNRPLVILKELISPDAGTKKIGTYLMICLNKQKN